MIFLIRKYQHKADTNMSSQNIISQLRCYQNILKSVPTNEDILLHVHLVKNSLFSSLVVKAKNRAKKSTNKKNRKNAIKRASENARRRANAQYEKQISLFSEFKLNAVDGWQNRMITENGEYVFVFRGYVINIDSDLNIINISETQVLQSTLTYIDVIVHLEENGCQFDDYFLQDKLVVAQAINSTKYSDYLPRPPKLRRSYNGDLYQQVAKIIIADGWENRTMCLFDEHCYVFQFRGVKYTVDIYNDKIDKITEF